jgi:pimeloyl-ACP methyl ester carboxylesterase
LPGPRPSGTVREVNGKLDRPGGALHFEIIDATPPWLGEAPLIVFHHGIGATADIWAEWLPALADLLIGADLTPELGRIGVPTLLLAPARSSFVPLAVMEAIHAAIPGSELAVFADARHGLPCSHGPACGRALRAFLARRVPSAA